MALRVPLHLEVRLGLNMGAVRIGIIYESLR